MAIIFNAVANRYETTAAPRPFAPNIRNLVQNFTRSVVLHIPRNASPQDIAAAHGVVGMDLCHHLSFGDIEMIVIEYLNRHISLNQFCILIGSVLRPSWLNLLFPPVLYQLGLQWAHSVVDRVKVVAARYGNDPARTVQAANALVVNLNNAVNNLRYGHSSTNRSIQGHFDLRLHRGLTLDPFMIATLIYAHAQGRPAYSAESSALLNDWELIAVTSAGNRIARRGVPGIAGGIKQSESNAPVGITGSGQPIMGSPIMPVRDRFTRGSIRWWLPVSADSLLLIIGAYVLYVVFFKTSGE